MPNLAAVSSQLGELVLQVLSWIDICAGLAAKTVARGPVVTASVDSVHFLRPCHQGSVAIIAAMVNRVFRSSMEARLCCFSYPCDGESMHLFNLMRLESFQGYIQK